MIGSRLPFEWNWVLGTSRVLVKLGRKTGLAGLRRNRILSAPADVTVYRLIPPMASRNALSGSFFRTPRFGRAA